MSKISGRLITYCTNIHPGESWQETFAALRRHVPAVKAAVSPNAPFPIGLRLSGKAAAELTPELDREFRDWLQGEECFVPTINGFPFGPFHDQAVKEGVYLPDWRSPYRRAYTMRLADLLAGWLPEGMVGSISTVPLGFKATLAQDPNHHSAIMLQLKSVLDHLHRVHQQTGKKIVLALEPEPGCLLETTGEICGFFETLPFAGELREHLGICYDCCHQAVQFEDPATSLRQLAAARVPVAKVHVSSALKLSGAEAAMAFHEPCYLHQVAIRSRSGAVLRYPDLPAAVSSHDSSHGDQWRCHFHVPVFSHRHGEIETTQDFLTSFLPLTPRNVLLEVETYTWEVLPEEIRGSSVTDSVIRELRWLQGQLHA
jgi:hypothetical protein